MLHLFNKVYLEFDDKIEINFDRVVISERYGIQMLQQLDKVAYGQLISFGASYNEVVGGDFAGFVATLRDFGKASNKKIIIYCDKEAYKKVIAQWFKSTLPNLDFDTFKNIVDYTVYNQRIVSNTQLSSVYSVDLNCLWEGLDDIQEAWDSTVEINPVLFKNLELNYSYEFLMATYLSGDDSKKEELKATMHMFLRRWFKELLADNRQMVLFNIVNHKFLSTFDINPADIDITSLDPLSNIEQFKLYADDEIWERDQNQYGVCKLEGLPAEKAEALVALLIKVYDEFEGMQIDRSVFGMLKFITAVTGEGLSDEDLDSIITYVVQTPCDTCLVPRFDFQNVNFPLLQYFLTEKFNERDLSKYRLL